MQLALSDGLPLHGRCPVSIEDGGDSGGAARRRGGWIVNPEGWRWADWSACCSARSGSSASPGGDKSSFAVVGAAAFLAASMQMPLTAVALVMEFTHMDHSYLAPALLCAAGAFLTCRVLDKK